MKYKNLQLCQNLAKYCKVPQLLLNYDINVVTKEVLLMVKADPGNRVLNSTDWLVKQKSLLFVKGALK